MAQGVERRVSVRHDTVDDRTSVEIMDCAGNRTGMARLVNFSTTGALILTDQLPTLHQPVRVRIELAKEVGWFVAVPVRLGGPDEVGVEFGRSFPLDFLPECLPDDDSTVGEEFDD